jgi:pimeloyl-[acyl-carrier protein] methyl ester esterase
MAETLNFTNYPNKCSSNKDKKISIVLIHGWGLNSAIWQPLLESFPDDFLEYFNIITIDLPGFGSNIDIEASPYSLANICQSINETIAEPAIYLGWSLGGLVATEMTLRYPQKVLGLITVASSPRFLEENSSVQEGSLPIWPGIKSQVFNTFHQQLQVDIKKTINGFLKIQAMGSPHIRQDIKQISQLVFKHKMASQATLEQSLLLLKETDFRSSLQDIHQPFLRIYGYADGLVPRTAIENISKLSKSSDLHVIEKASHAPFISHVSEFSQLLSDWLSVQYLPSVK